MTGNFTYSEGLIQSITNQNWFANPAGIEGKEVILLEKVGDQGSRFYCSLKPGQTLRLGERMFSKYDALAVDMRLGRTFQVSGEFATRDRGKRVKVTANVRYRVTAADVLVLKASDPLAELRDKVLASLNRDMAQYPEGQINASLIEKIIRNVGPAPHIGLAIEDADVLSFEPDTSITEHTKQIEQAQHENELQEIRRRADLLAQQQQNDADILRRQARHDNIPLTDINVLMHEHPDLISQVFNHFASRDQAVLRSQMELMAPVIKAYISQKEDEGASIDPDELSKMIQRTLAPSKGNLQGSLDAPKLIAWGDESQPKQPSEKSPLKFEGKPEDNDNEDYDRIKFGKPD